jgi:carbamoyltransferase
MHILRHFKNETGQTNLTMAGGVALNCSANGVIHRSRTFHRMFIQPAAGDDGSALGAALHVRSKLSRGVSLEPMTVPLWGPEFGPDEIIAAVNGTGACRVKTAGSTAELVTETARLLAGGAILGWFQGRMEFGPRALGNRSILADPRDSGMRSRVNALIKKREGFRPFAPAVTAEDAATYFKVKPGEESLFATMLFVTHVRRAYRDRLPAVTHVDGSARVQTVAERDNPRFWRLLKEFGRVSGMPVLLNTSFNVKGQPIVCTPAEAVETFLFAGLDALVIGDLIVTRVVE